jgi:endonuclease-3
MRKKSEILEIMQVFEKENPNPQCELNYTSAFTLLVAVVLSAQTTDKGVNRATEELFKIADTPQKMVALGEERLISYIRTIGLFNNKAFL